MLTAWLRVLVLPSVLPRPTASGNLDMKNSWASSQIFWIRNLGGWNPSICVITSQPGDSDAHKSENSKGNIISDFKLTWRQTYGYKFSREATFWFSSLEARLKQIKLSPLLPVLVDRSVLIHSDWGWRSLDYRRGHLSPPPYCQGHWSISSHT